MQLQFEKEYKKENVSFAHIILSNSQATFELPVVVPNVFPISVTVGLSFLQCST